MIYDRFCDYMYYLLLSPLKKIKKPRNQWYLLFTVLGRRMDAARRMVCKAALQTMAATCDEDFLPVFARERRLVRYERESAENFRKRIVNCAEIYKYGGTDVGIVKTVRSLGYEDVKIAKAKELTGDPERWAEFYVIINMDVTAGWHIHFSALKDSVRSIKQVGAKDNYLFVFGGESRKDGISGHCVDVCIVVCSDVTNVHETAVMPVVLAGINVINEVDVKVLTNVWRLDGSHKLNGTMRLNANVEDYRWGQS